jgi:NAD(P)H-nitrite reductase large subunit
VRARDVGACAATLAAAARVLIIGGGVVGVELAAEIAHYHKHACVTVADVSPRLLATLPRAAGERAAAALSAAGVRLLLGAPLARTPVPEAPSADGTAAVAPRFTYATSDGDAVPADVVFTCVGARPNSACLHGVPLDARGCVQPRVCASSVVRVTHSRTATLSRICLQLRARGCHLARGRARQCVRSRRPGVQATRASAGQLCALGG